MSARGGRGRLTPYLVGLPGGLWLAIFFVVPLLVMFSLSLQSGNTEQGFLFTWEWSNYSHAWSSYSTQFIRSVVYALIVTALCLVLAYPMAYWIAFYGGARKSTYLFLILLPFFVSFVIRTASWKFILNDEGFVLGPLKEAGLLSADFHLLATTTAVIAGITYNYLPFMALPLYVSLERIDRRLIEAATDLYASRTTAFRKVTLPLAVPGILAGSLLTFIPAVGDFINAQLLGTSRQYMIGNVIQSKFLVIIDYPAAAALSFLMMAALLAMVFVYVRVIGSTGLRAGAAAR